MEKGTQQGSLGCMSKISKMGLAILKIFELEEDAKMGKQSISQGQELNQVEMTRFI